MSVLNSFDYKALLNIGYNDYENCGACQELPACLRTHNLFCFLPSLAMPALQDLGL